MSSPTSLTIVSQNAAGLKSNNRLDHFIAGVQADVILIQEHGLHDDDKRDEKRLRQTAKRYGYLVAVTFIPEYKRKGGTLSD